MDWKPQIDAYWARPDRQRALVDATARLVAVPSVKGEPQPGAPFGAGLRRCLDEALALCRELGFAVENVDGYVGTADLNGRETALHILGHLDVVDAGAGWTREPFQVTEEGGLLYGRGVADDKGPVAAALLAMRCVRDLGVELPYNAKLILGTDEESGSADIAYYYGRAPYAKYTFSPDADFPLIHIEKGMYQPVFSRTFAPTDAVPRVVSLTGGFRINVIPGEAEAVLPGLDAAGVQEALTRTAAETGVSFQAEEDGGRCRILARGAGGHASLPEGANNALTGLLRLLAALPLADCDSTRAVRHLAALFPHGDGAGRALGIAVSDALSGPTTAALTLLRLDESGAEGRFDSRTALAATEENTRRAAEAALARGGFRCTGAMTPPHHTPADSPIVQKLLRCYRLYTGETDARPLAIGGGTYVHGIPGGVAFGCERAGFSSNMHGADARIPVETLVLSARVCSQALSALCG